MITKVLLLLLGFVLLIKGANYFVLGSSSLATNYKVPKKLIGLTIIAFGTSAPELAISLNAMMSSNSDIILGNVIGSNIVNVLLVLGIGGLICPIRITSATIKKEMPLLLLISVMLVTLFLDTSFNGGVANEITRSDGIILLFFFLIFIYYLISIIRNREDKDEETAKYGKLKSVIVLSLGLAGVIIGSDLVVDSAKYIATSIGISDRVIALTIIALGTSLPELVTTIVSAVKKEQDILVGNIIGTNIFNICVVLGLPVAIFGSITPTFSFLDIAMLLLSSIILYIFSLSDYKITKLESVIMVMICIFYYICIFL